MRLLDVPSLRTTVDDEWSGGDEGAYGEGLGHVHVDEVEASQEREEGWRSARGEPRLLGARQMAINGNPWQSMAIGAHQMAIACYSSRAIDGHEWQSMAINGNQWQSMAINGRYLRERLEAAVDLLGRHFEGTARA